MTLGNYFIDRGKRGNTPALNRRADETFVEFCSDARNFLLHRRWASIGKLGNKIAEKNGVSIEHTTKCVEKLRDVIATSPELATFLRTKRSFQEAYKDRIINSYNLCEEDWLRKLDAADKTGPGSVTYDLDFETPEYAKVEIHLQPKGYDGHDLAGLYYDYGTQIFFGGAADADALHKGLATKTASLVNGEVDRYLEIGCSCGQLACQLKTVYPNAEAWGTDISAAMVRYAHWRAIEHNFDVHFSQMASENMDFPDNHFDLVTSHILFHEIPLPVIRETLNEVKRVLRPGGTFVIWDFGSSAPDNPGYAGFLGLMDAADNCEPYAPGFVTCNIEGLLEETGFNLRDLGENGRQITGRVAEKPAA